MSTNSLKVFRLFPAEKKLYIKKIKIIKLLTFVLFGEPLKDVTEIVNVDLNSLDSVSGRNCRKNSFKSTLTISVTSLRGSPNSSDSES